MAAIGLALFTILFLPGGRTRDNGGNADRLTVASSRCLAIMDILLANPRGFCAGCRSRDRDRQARDRIARRADLTAT